MKFSPLTAGLVALALVSAAGVADANTKKAPGQNAVERQDATQQLPAIKQFLAKDKDLSKMKLARLQQRLHRAQKFHDLSNLPTEYGQALEVEIARVSAEISSREQSAAKPKQP